MKNNKGFTLMEMLIVVAIIAVLVAIAIPTMTSALEKSREATDAANIRSAYAQVMVQALTEEELTAPKTVGKITYAATTKDSKNVRTWSATVTAVQKQDGWQSAITEIGGVEVKAADATLNGWTIKYVEGAVEATIAPTTKS